MRSSGLMLGIGLAIGAAAGAGGMYLALSSRNEVVDVVVDVDVDVDDPAKPAPPKKRTRRGRTAPTDAALDTRLVWKGEPVEKPPASVDMAADGEARSLDGGEIQAAIDAGGSALTDCVGRAIGSVPWEGDVTLKLLVDGDGKVAKSRVRAPAFAHEHGLYECMRQGAARLRFAAAGGWTVVTVPFPVSVE